MIKNFCFITWKGLYPYVYMDSCDKFQGIHLPPKKAYLSKLNMKGIRDHGISDYENAQQARNIMEKKNQGFIGDTYLKTDVLLLADLFQTFWNTCLEQDLAHAYILPD